MDIVIYLEYYDQGLSCTLGEAFIVLYSRKFL
jgi:hypothetical protein